MCDLCRRSFIRGAVALGGASLFASPVLAAARADPKAARSAARLPARGEFVVRNAYVMTMDPALGDIPGGSVHVKNGEIVAVGKDVAAPGARVLDGAGMIVLPGLVETHWHMWNTLFRSFAGDQKDHGYFPTVARFGMQMTPDDMYQGARLAAAEAVNSGMTSVHDWCHNVRSRAHAEADLQALKDVGLRARFSYGWPQGRDDKDIMEIADLEAVHRDWKTHSNDGLITLGLAWRGMFRAGPIPENVYRTELEAARRLGIPVTVHAGSASTGAGQIATLAKANTLGKDVQIIHAVAATPEEIDLMKDAGVAVSVAPASELRIGFGMPKTSELIAAGIPVGVSVDTSALVGGSSLFAVLKTVRDVENARALSEFKMPARRVLELGTIDGARSMGIDDKVGSLKPGKRADLIMIDTRAVNMGVFTDPAHMVVECTMPENVDTVVVDGRILKRSGKLTAVAANEVVAGARAALEGIRQRTNWR
jgi:cytosine/adenosine deaminase-related metal-dependent hydrolase